MLIKITLLRRAVFMILPMYWRYVRGTYPGMGSFV